MYVCNLSFREIIKLEDWKPDCLVYLTSRNLSGQELFRGLRGTMAADVVLCASFSKHGSL
jgi:hypothetical protein